MSKVKEKRKFKLLKGAGPHFEPNPDFDPDSPEDDDNIRDVEYAPGSIVTSTRPLDKLFVNKFQPIEGADPGQTSGGDVHDRRDDPNADRPVRSVEDANVRSADRFLEDEELEGKEDLKKLAKGKKVEPHDEDEDAEDFFEEEAPKKSKKKKKSKE